MKRNLSVGLVIVLFASVFLFHSKAYALSGGGTSGNPYLINTCSDFQSINSAPSAYYKLADDIDCADESTGAGFLPLTSDSLTPFTGTLDGNHRTISNLVINRPTTNAVGLFTYIDGAIIKNLTFLSPHVTGQSQVGTLVGMGYDTPSTISNITITSPTIVAHQTAGGLLGEILSANISRVIIRDASISGNEPAGTANDIGGVVGTASHSNLSEIYVQGNVTGNTIDLTHAAYTGGVFGQDGDYNTFTNIYNNTNVIGAVDSGAFAGNMMSHTTISNSYSNGYSSTLQLNAYASAFVGVAYGGTLNNIFTVANPSGTRAGLGVGLLGITQAGAVTHVNFGYWDVMAVGTSRCIGTDGGSDGICFLINDTGTQPNYFQSKTNAPLSTWDFTDIWKEVTGDLPTLSFMAPPELTINATPTTRQMNVFWTSVAGSHQFKVTEMRYKQETGDSWHYLTIASPDTTTSQLLSNLNPNSSYIVESHIVNDQNVGHWLGFITSTMAESVVAPALPTPTPKATTYSSYTAPAESKPDITASTDTSTSVPILDSAKQNLETANTTPKEILGSSTKGGGSLLLFGIGFFVMFAFAWVLIKVIR